MTTTLIKLQDKFILVSDEEIKYPDYVWNGEHILGIAKVFTPEGQKIIAGIPELPIVDFSLLTEEECKKIGWTDIRVLALIDYKELLNKQGEARTQLVGHSTPFGFNKYMKGYKAGFKKAESINDKLFTQEEKTLLWFGKKYTCEEDCLCHTECPKADEYIQSLQQTSWDVKVEMEDVFTTNEESYVHSTGAKGNYSTHSKRPKITNNSIKIIKLL